MINQNCYGRGATAPESATPVISFSSADSNRVIVYLVNKSEKEKKVNVVFNSLKPTLVNAYEYFGGKPEDMHPVWQTKKDVSRLKGLSISVFEYQF